MTDFYWPISQGVGVNRSAINLLPISLRIAGRRRSVRSESESELAIGTAEEQRPTSERISPIPETFLRRLEVDEGVRALDRTDRLEETLRAETLDPFHEFDAVILMFSDLRSELSVSCS